MAEEFTSITAARRQLPRLSEIVQRGGERYVITNQGKPQAVLLGYEEYKGLLAAAELLSRPRELRHLEEGLAQTERLTFEQLKASLEARKKSQTAAGEPGRIEVQVLETQAKPLPGYGPLGVTDLNALHAEFQRIWNRLADAVRSSTEPGAAPGEKSSRKPKPGSARRAAAAHATSEAETRHS